MQRGLDQHRLPLTFCDPRSNSLVGDPLGGGPWCRAEQDCCSWDRVLYVAVSRIQVSGTWLRFWDDCFRDSMVYRLLRRAKRRERVSIRCLGVNDMRTCGSARMSGIVGMDMIGPYSPQPLPSSTQNSVQGGVKWSAVTVVVVVGLRCRWESNKSAFWNNPVLCAHSTQP